MLEAIAQTCPLPDRRREQCGVFAIYALGEDVARLTFFALYALQHRGQESTGIAVSDSCTAHIHKGMGLVSQVFTEENLRLLRGHLAIGHNRYSTTGSSRLRNAQPYLIETALGPLGVAHNGNLTNRSQLRNRLVQRGGRLTSSSDSEVITQMLANATGESWEERICSFMQEARGAYSLAILSRQAFYAVRDPWGFRPLCMGKLDRRGWGVASESCALDAIGAEYVREVKAGEIIRVDENGLSASQGAPPARQALCVFEYIYFARPDSLLGGESIHLVRRRLGERLAIEHPARADMVMGIPDSATSAAIGYARQSKIPFGEGLMKNHYIGRIFIEPDERLRRMGVALKFKPLPDTLRGKRVVVVDDSIVRGNTSKPIVSLLRQAGAAEVHMRVASSPIRHPCFMGVDMTTYEELIAHRLSIAGIREYLGADSLGYLSLEGMVEAIGHPHEGHCLACFSGDYPVESEMNAVGKYARVCLNSHFGVME
jgi:amidophosphoribosyltransferase